MQKIRFLWHFCIKSVFILNKCIRHWNEKLRLDRFINMTHGMASFWPFIHVKRSFSKRKKTWSSFTQIKLTMILFSRHCCLICNSFYSPRDRLCARSHPLVIASVRDRFVCNHIHAWLYSCVITSVRDRFVCNHIRAWSFFVCNPHPCVIVFRA